MTITGTRAIGGISGGDLDERFHVYLGPFATRDAHCYFGGAVGLDTAALGWLAENSGVGLTVVLPCTLADQPVNAAEAIARWRRRGRLDQVVELQASELATDAYRARNRWMVDRSEFVIGFPRGGDPASGTWYTLTYAADHGKPRLIVPI